MGESTEKESFTENKFFLYLQILFIIRELKKKKKKTKLLERRVGAMNNLLEGIFFGKSFKNFISFYLFFIHHSAYNCHFHFLLISLTSPFRPPSSSSSFASREMSSFMCGGLKRKREKKDLAMSRMMRRN